jgi:hypothetical protein
MKKISKNKHFTNFEKRLLCGAMHRWENYEKNYVDEKYGLHVD